jgi:hypothetical protein
VPSLKIEKMYKYRNRHISKLKGVEKLEGEPIEHKIERIVTNKEPISDGAPSIYTERKEGVVSAYNIRTDRWEIATDAMNVVQKSIQAKRDGKGSVTKKKEETKVVKLETKKEDGGAKPTQGQEASK